MFVLQISFITGMIYFYFFDPHTQLIQASNLQQFSTELVDISAKINPALVSIVAKQDIDFYEANPWYLMHNGTKKQLSGGSGFFVLGGKYVLTSAHVVESSSSEYIVVVSGGRKLDAKMVWSDASGSDLALLRVYDEEHNLYMHHAFLDIASHNNIHPGSVVLAFGNPFLSFPNTTSM